MAGRPKGRKKLKHKNEALGDKMMDTAGHLLIVLSFVGAVCASIDAHFHPKMMGMIAATVFGMVFLHYDIFKPVDKVVRRWHEGRERRQARVDAELEVVRAEKAAWAEEEKKRAAQASNRNSKGVLAPPPPPRPYTAQPPLTGLLDLSCLDVDMDCFEALDKHVHARNCQRALAAKSASIASQPSRAAGE